jgi:aminodeoxyfutalosine deaminase
MSKPEALPLLLTSQDMPGENSRQKSLIDRLPKVELHLHLEGSARPETLLELARLKGRNTQAVEDWITQRSACGFRYKDFNDFIEAFKGMALLLETPADYALATTRLIEELARQNVRYAEVTLSAGVVIWKKQSLQAVFEAVAAAAAEAEARRGVRVRWIFDAIRQLGAQHAREALAFAARFRPLGVVAFGIGGDEARGPAELFPDVYRAARDAGLHTTAHAGETCGPQSIRLAVELLGAERIGHGLSAARDAGVMALLRERRVPLEVCLSSNVSTGVLARVQDHPLPRFLAEGLAVTLNSDDPAMFGTSLTREFELAAENFSLAPRQLVGLLANAARAAFLPEEEKRPLVEEIERASAD